MKHTLSLLGVVVIAHASPLYAADRNAPGAAASVRPPAYRSAFEGYRPAGDEPLADWRALNDDVAAIGGHVGMLRDAGPRPTESTGKPGASSRAADRIAPAPSAAGHEH
jgi:hypothetical protein